METKESIKGQDATGAVCDYLCANEAAGFVTGITIPVDGGDFLPAFSP